MAREVIARSDKFTITEEPHTCTARCDHDEYRTSEDDNDEFWHEDPEVLEWLATGPVFVSEPREDNPNYGHYEPTFIDWKKANTCDECSDLTTGEDVVRCPDGKIRCVTCVEAMYRENGGQ